MQHHFDIDIAKEYGILEAVLLDHLYFWIEKNKANGTNFIDGKYWTFNSKKAFAELLPYANERQIKYALDKLREAGVIEVASYNKSNYDRTLFYTITEVGYSKLHHCPTEWTKLSNQADNNVQPIPYTNTYTYTDTNGNTTSSKDSVVLPMGQKVGHCPTETDRKADKETEEPTGSNKWKALSESVVGYLNERLGKQGREVFRVVPPTIKLITARAKEGATLEDFKAVIDKKYAEWWDNGDMKKFIRPATLFAPSHFWDYLGESHPTTVKRVGASGVEYEVNADREDEFDGIF